MHASSPTPTIGTHDTPVPIRPCEPWCTDGTGHPDEFPGDRNCRSDGQGVALTLEEPYPVSESEWVMPVLDVTLRRDRRATDTTVMLWNSGTGAEVAMTRDEARELGLRLLEAAQWAEQ